MNARAVKAELAFCLMSLIGAGSASAEVELPDLTGEFEYEVQEITPVNKTFFPRVFTGYRNLRHPQRFTSFPDQSVAAQVARELSLPQDTLVNPEDITDLESMDIVPTDSIIMPDLNPDVTESSMEELTILSGTFTPDWLRRSLDTYRFQEDFIYSMMIENPGLIQYAYWDLPEPPRLPEEDFSFKGYLKRLNLPELPKTAQLPVHANGGRINWLHTLNISLQLSQAYLSGNWYQGGTSHLSFLGGFLWDVQLNQAYYPNAMFQSTVSYKLAINSTPDDQYHRYNVSQDLFQYNMKAGYKALRNWYYSMTMQFKTQFLNSYPTNSPDRSASFLSPGEFNVGLGMTYTKQNEKKTMTFSASIAPVSYNLKTCIDPLVDHLQFGIEQNRKWLNEIGSNAEVNFKVTFWGNTTYITRLFIFSDYKDLQTDWENTLNFQFSKLFSTQIYAHLRYDTSADPSLSPRWGKFMLKEILSVGISYNFSTK
ncbi:MAG: DUF3078 domain-containing protein [Muribaculaceae bacterium]|nr:DUF3078 domain-containing protein [Muribaculaceae bacterium]